MDQITKKTPTQLHYPERSVFMKERKSQKNSNLELGSQDGVNVPIQVYVVFQQNDREKVQNLNNDTFVRLSHPLKSLSEPKNILMMVF